MPNKAKSHEECRKTVCLLWMKKLAESYCIAVWREEEGKDVKLPNLFNFSFYQNQDVDQRAGLELFNQTN